MSRTKKLTLKQTPGFESQIFPAVDLQLLEPVGISVGTHSMRPLLLLKSLEGQQILPVGLNPLEAGVTLGQSSQNSMPVSTHRVLQELLQTLSLRIERAVFCEIKGPHQYVHLQFRALDRKTDKVDHSLQEKFGDLIATPMRVRADEAMSVCLHLKVPLYAPAEFIRKSRVLNSDLEVLSAGLELKPGLVQKTHPYVM